MQHFSRFRYPSTVLRTAIGNSFTPNQRYRWKAETLKVCLLPVWRVCDQALLNGVEKWSCNITEIENLHIETRRKMH